MRRLALLTALLTVSVGAPAHAVVGGQTVGAGDYPWQVALVDGGFFFCGGTLIQPDRVLTAAHCTAGMTAGPTFEVLAGTRAFALGGTAQLRSVVEIANHPQALDTPLGITRFDAAILELSSPVDVTGPGGARALSVGTIPGTPPAVGTEARITGWGGTEAREPTDPTASPLSLDAFRVGSVERIADTTCDDDAKFSATDMLCAARPGVDTCQGDSGGPIMAAAGAVVPTSAANWNLIGITSWGNGCAWPDNPGVYTRLSANPIRSFVTTTTGVLITQPRNVGAPTVTGEVHAGGRATCFPGQWSAPASFDYAWQRLDSPQDPTPEFVAGTQSYMVGDADVGQYLGCLVTAQNDGGSASAVSDFLLASSAPAPAQPVAATSPALPVPPDSGPPATVLPQVDTNAPTSRVSGRRCPRRRCTISVVVADRGTAGVRALTATLVRRRPGRRAQRVTLRLRRLSRGVYELRTPPLTRGSYTLTLRAIDRAGNRQERATVARFRIA